MRKKVERRKLRKSRRVAVKKLSTSQPVIDDSQVIRRLPTVCSQFPSDGDQAQFVRWFRQGVVVGGANLREPDWSLKQTGHSFTPFGCACHEAFLAGFMHGRSPKLFGQAATKGKK